MAIVHGTSNDTAIGMSGADAICLALHERRLEHATSATRGYVEAHGGPAGEVATDRPLFRALAERHGAAVFDTERREPRNIGRNYYDGGHDFAVSNTLVLAFDGARAAAAFLAEARPMLVAWLAIRTTHSATLPIDGAELNLCGDDELELALAVLVRIANPQPAGGHDRTGTE